MKDWLYPGAEVVWCRGKAFSWWPEQARAYLRKGRVYVIAAIHQSHVPGVDAPFLSFTDSPAYPSGAPMQFDSRGFRPLTKRPTDISVFTDLLHDVKRTEPVMLDTPGGKVAA